MSGNISLVSHEFRTNESSIFLGSLKEREKNELFRYVQVRWCLPCIASWDRSECRSPGSSGTAWRTVSAAAWWKRSPWSRKTGTVRKKNFHSFQKVHKLIQIHFFFFFFSLFIFAMLAHFSTFGRAASLSAWNSPMVHNHICNLHSCKAILYAT